MGIRGRGLEAASRDAERRRRRDEVRASHAAAVLRAMDLLQRGKTIDHGASGILRLCLGTFSAEAALVLCGDDDAPTVLFAEGDPDAAASDLVAGAGIFAGARRIADLATSSGRAFAPATPAYRSLLSVPFRLDPEQPAVLALFAARPAAFTRFDQLLLRRLAGLLERAFERLSLLRRNAVLVGLLDEPAGPATDGADELDGSFGALSRTLDRIVDWQGQIVEITDTLLSCPSAGIDDGVNEALARTGALAGSDRTYVFRLGRPGFMDNTHEWVRTGVEPMIHRLQDVPIELLDEWRPFFDIGRPVDIRDVGELPRDSALKDVLAMQGIRSLLAVPMLRDGRIVGFVGYDSVQRTRRFLPIEIQLLRSVANAINVMLDRADAEASADQARARMQAERDRLKATLSALPDLVLELDADGRFASFNEGGVLAPHVPPDRFLGRLPEDVLPGDLAALVRAVMARVDADGRAEGSEYRLDVDGAERWYSVTAAPRSLSAAPGGYVLVVRDVTVARTQRREIQRLGKIAELTSNMVIVTDADERIEWVNPAFERLTGWRLEEVRGRKPGAFLQSPDADRDILRAIGDALAQRRPIQAELLNRTRSGASLWIRKDIQPLKDDAGRLEGFIAVQTDITDLKLSHDRALRERAAAMEASTDGIAITQADGRFVFMNRTHRDMFGVGPDEDVTALHWTELYEPEAAARLRDAAWPQIETQGFWRGEMSGRHRDGRPVPQDIALTRQEDGGLLCITRDVSERIRAAQEQTMLREELQRAQRRETIAHIAAGVAHDLNNLVAVVAATASQLEARRDADAELAEAIARIRRAMVAARDLVGGLQDMDRPERPRGAHDLRRLVSQGVELLGVARIRRHGVSVALPDAPLIVQANPTEILQVVVNLALNGCEADDEKPPRVSVAVLPDGSAPPDRAPDVGSCRDDVRYALFAVSDDGAGVDAAALPRLFERYFTTKGSKGTGLGMPIVANILRKNGAALWLDTRPGVGTTVTIAWPGVPVVAALQPDEPRDAGDVADLSGMTVLVVDDVADVAQVLDDMLETAGATVVSTDDPGEAQRLLSENPHLWSALVTDLDMPGIDGIALARLAGSLEPPTPALLVTALSDRVGADGALFHAVLSKPVDAARLSRAVKEAATRARASSPRNPRGSNRQNARSLRT